MSLQPELTLGGVTSSCFVPNILKNKPGLLFYLNSEGRQFLKCSHFTYEAPAAQKHRLIGVCCLTTLQLVINCVPFALKSPN